MDLELRPEERVEGEEEPEQPEEELQLEQLEEVGRVDPEGRCRCSRAAVATDTAR